MTIPNDMATWRNTPHCCMCKSLVLPALLCGVPKEPFGRLCEVGIFVAVDPNDGNPLNEWAEGPSPAWCPRGGGE